jgi:hypothetical protein
MLELLAVPSSLQRSAPAAARAVLPHWLQLCYGFVVGGGGGSYSTHKAQVRVRCALPSAAASAPLDAIAGLALPPALLAAATSGAGAGAGYVLAVEEVRLSFERFSERAFSFLAQCVTSATPDSGAQGMWQRAGGRGQGALWVALQR